MVEHQGVMVIGEAKNGKLTGMTGELLGGGRRLASELGGELSCLLIGSAVNGQTREAITLGADKVFVVNGPLLKDYVPESYTLAAEKVVKKVSPQILLLGQTEMGRDLAPRLAFRLGTAVTTDCVELVIDPATKKLQATKPVFGGNAMAVFTSDVYPEMATVRSKVLSALERSEGRQMAIFSVAVELTAASLRTRLVERVVEETAGIRLEDAEVVVAGGRGIERREDFKQLEELAGLLKGAVGASRPPCDNRWMPASQQIGLTGKIIAPRLYVAVAISGSSQHMTGVSGAKTIVAINKDPEANIFRRANYGVVGDYRKALPAFVATLKSLLNAS
jgi:electron transfer flavoprotein alpha subunit